MTCTTSQKCVPLVSHVREVRTSQHNISPTEYSPKLAFITVNGENAENIDINVMLSIAILTFLADGAVISFLYVRVG